MPFNYIAGAILDDIIQNAPKIILGFGRGNSFGFHDDIFQIS
jgi:hypothetical protein